MVFFSQLLLLTLYNLKISIEQTCKNKILLMYKCYFCMNITHFETRNNILYLLILERFVITLCKVIFIYLSHRILDNFTWLGK